MSDDRQRVRQVFMEVADLPATEQEAALFNACHGDAALRSEVEALLQVDANAVGFMASPTRGSGATLWNATPSVEPAPREQAGQVIGRYQLLQPIGEGGFGIVWMAKQREPVRRRVALKIIKLGMDTTQVIARFEAERQALAMMDHPNIAKVLDAGSTESGRPYFVMEYINGVPIVEYCDANTLDTRARLSLFTSVCNAIQHAHQKGIIHRDIKPSNILVTMHDGIPVPKVIDFGIAKATNSELTQKTLFTEHRQLVGTPAYMSPEQAEMSGLDIDTRSDIYSLGVLLYELLTGTTPFDSNQLRAAAFGEIQRIIRDMEPPRPSTRISALGNALASTAAHRCTEPRKLRAIVEGELDWIVMKSLEKDRRRRYETASALAMDIQRHLHGEPVTAAPPSNGYRLRKFLRRNRAPAVLAAVIACALLVSLVGVGAGLIRAEMARKSESLHRAAAEASAKEASLNASRANRISEFLSSMLSSLYVSQSPGNDVKVRPIIDDASRRLDSGQLRDDPEIEAVVRMKLGDTYRCTLQDEYSAEREYALAAAAFERVLGPTHRETLQAMYEVGIALHKQGRYAEAETMARLILERRSQAFGEEDEDTIESMEKLSWVLSARGNFAEAEPLRVRALELCRKVHGDDHPATITAFKYLGNLYVEQGRIADAETQYRQALERARRYYGADTWQASFAMVDGVANCLVLRGEFDEALEVFNEALRIQRAFGDKHLLSRTLSKLGAACTKAGRYEEAERALTEALELVREVAKGHDAEAWTLFDFGMLRASQNRLVEAETFMREGLAIRHKLAAAHGKAGDPWSLRALASVLGAQGRQEEANRLLLEADAVESPPARD